MKRVFTLMIGVATTLTSFSQLSIGVQTTGNLSDANIETEDFVSSSKKARLLPGAGIVADVRFTGGFSVRTGINFLQNGVKLNATISDLPGEISEIKTVAKLNMNYLQLPLSLLYTSKGDIQFYAGGGPYFSYAVSGKSIQESTYTFADGSTVKDKEESDPFEKDDQGNTSWRRTDFGAGIIAGVKFPAGFFANLGYQFSFSNLSKAEGEKYNNRGLQLTVGYMLWKK